MEKNRIEAFSDGVIAVAITLMVIELKPPALSGGFENLAALTPSFLAYVLSFIYVGIYWNNHHHLLSIVRTIDGAVLWANLHLLFWLTLFPFSTAWVSQQSLAVAPAATYGVNLLMAALAYYALQWTLVRAQGPESVLKAALGHDWKGRASPAAYVVGIAAAFYKPWAADLVYAGVALIWLIPDQRIERRSMSVTPS